MFIVGIDPGANGSAVMLDDEGNIVDIIEWNKNTERDIADALEEWSSYQPKAYLEKVHSMPKQGVSSTFKFGANFGFWQGILTALKIPYEFVTPQRWQQALSCRTKGFKNVTKRKAQQLFPKQKITHSTADAILIAVYGYRVNV